MPQPDTTNLRDRADQDGRLNERDMVQEQTPSVGSARTKDEPRRSWQDSVITLTVAVVAAAASYGHMFEVALLAGEPLWIARAFPITVDGLVLAALRRGPQGRWWLRLGVLVSVAANVVSRYPELAHTAGPLVSAWPPLALYGTHRLLHGARRTPEESAAETDIARSDGPADTTTRSVPAPTRVIARRPATAESSRNRASLADVTDVVTELEADGLPVNRTLVAKRVRAAGLSLSNERADRLLAQILENPERRVA